MKEPIAIVGMACRFPGGCDTLGKFWELLRSGGDVITEVGSDRWSKDYYFHPDPSTSGKSYTTSAGQLSDIYQFDPEFFGISPREAVQMDPQQRLLLQMSWEALENGGQVPSRLAGSDCSVYVGISSLDYANNRMDDPNVADAYFMTGNTLSIAANRLSYIYDLKGPSMAIDTACSSSLVALHQACSSIWSGESKSSIVGAVHLVLSPFPFIGFSKANMLSNNGRCRVFDAGADGYVRSEGGVVFFLKPLVDAKLEGDPIHAVIRGSAVNSDGNKSALTVPNGYAQTNLLRDVYAKAGIKSNDIDYIEAHGTGTPVGDPIEATAISNAFGKLRESGSPLLIGSVKSNIGHLEPASGFAGMLKVILSIKNREIPATIHQQQLNPNINFNKFNLKVVNKLITLDGIKRPLIMGVNSFGFGGTNAHTIIEEYVDDSKQLYKYPTEYIPPLYLSARSEESLKKRASQFYAILDGNTSKQEIYDTFYALAMKRESMKHSLVAFGNTVSEIREALGKFVEGKRTDHVVRTDTIPESGKVAFVFSGNGSQWSGMGKLLLKHNGFKTALIGIDKIFKPLSGWSLVEAISSEQEIGIEYTEVAQPVLFAIQVGIVELLKELGVTADVVIGHSVGEIAAAYIAGALSLEDAVKVIYFRSSAQGKTKGQGKMAAVRLAANDLQALLKNDNGDIEIAAVNSENSVTLSGSAAGLKQFIEQLQEQSVSCRELDIDYAFHNKVMDSIKDIIHTNLNDIKPRSADLEFISTVTGVAESGESLDNEYWWKNIRQPVQFGPAVSQVIDGGTRHFIEIGPHPVLQSYIRDSLRHKAMSGTFVRTLTRNDPDEYRSVLSAAYKTLFTNNLNKLNKVFPVMGNRVNLPEYPWNNAAYKFTGSNESINKRRSHPLLGFRNNELESIWVNHIDIQSHPYLADHCVDGVIIFPAAGFAEMALAAAVQWYQRDDVAISNLEIHKPMILEPGKTKVIQFNLSARDLTFSIKSRERLSDDSWIEHANGKLIQLSFYNMHENLNLENFQRPGYSEISKSEVYENASHSGLEYGENFQGVVKVLLGNDSQVLTEINLPAPSAATASEYILHPVVMDSAFHALFSLTQDESSSLQSYTYLPTEINAVNLYFRPKAISYSNCIIHSSSNNLIRASFALFDSNGSCVAEMKDCLFRKLPRSDASRKNASFYYYNQIPKNIINQYSASPLPSNQTLLESIDQIPDRDALISSELLMNEKIMPLFDAMASTIAEKTFRDFGAHLGLFTVDSLISTSMLSTGHKNYLTYLLGILEQDGKAYQHEDKWKMVDLDEIDDPVEIWRSILADYPEYVGQLRNTASYGLQSLEVISGNNNDEEVPSHQYKPDYSGISSLQEHVLQTLLEKIRQQWPHQKKRLRIAEIRNHLSNTSIDILSQLPEQYCDYEILALDEYSLTQAEDAYRENINVTVSYFDPAKGGLSQKYKEGEFDIVLLSHGMQRYHSLTDVFSQISYILASKGLLILMDKRPDRITDINMGMAQANWWQSSIGDESPVSSQLHPDEWIYLLENTGFQESVNLMDEMAQGFYRYVIIARRPERTINKSVSVTDQVTSCILIASGDSESGHIAHLLKSETVREGVQSTVVVENDLDVSSNEHVVLDLLDEADQSRLQQLIESQADTPLKIIYLAELSKLNTDSAQTLEVGHRVSMTNMKLINFINSLVSAKLSNIPTVWLVTSGAVYGSNVLDLEFNPNPYQAGLWSIGRVIRNEFPDIDFRMIDIQSKAMPTQISHMLWNEIHSGDGEEEIILTEDNRKALRLDKKDINVELFDRAKLNGINKIYQLGFSRAGSIENLEWRAAERKLPGTNEVEVEVRATGLNFRDIMYTSGFLPGEMLEGGLSGATLGLECSGIVSQIGDGIESLDVGDEVIALAPACFSSHIIASKYSVVKKPEKWSFEAAATVPTAFFTVYYALNYLARLSQGERILIHGAAGGVGLAAIQYAHHCGAEIFATAGTPEKRKFLEYLGVDHVLDSRTLEFADQIMTITDNEGVDVVLNSLAGEAIARNFKVLRPFGRFLELGKRDFFENTKLDLKPFRNNITYYGIDADQLLQYEPELSSRLMQDVMQLFNDEIFRPLPYVSYGSNDIVSAFRHMQQSHHIGKVVVSHTSTSIKINAERKTASLELNPNGTYLITGGLRGFGLATAGWLSSKGARHLVLLGRSEIDDQNSLNAVAKLRADDIDVKIIQCDVTDAIKMQAVLHDIQETKYPLKGIVHAAMVLEDNLIANIDYENLYKVLAPKVQGAWNLHKLTKDYSLDLFIMYSSVTTSFGNPGQANYVAANAFLESLAKFRKKSGLAATVISWDAITDTGYLARNEQLAGRLTKRLGAGGITSKQAFDAMEMLILNDLTEMIIFNANWSALKRALPVLNSHLYKNILHGLDINENIGGDDLIDLLAGLEDSERQPVVVNFLISEIARILQMPEEKIAHNCTIQDLGVDSLMAMELATTIEVKMGINLPVMTLADNITLDGLANRLVNMIDLGVSPDNTKNSVDDIVSSLAKIHAEDLTEEEMKSISHDINNGENNSKRLIQ